MRHLAHPALPGVATASGSPGVIGTATSGAHDLWREGAALGLLVAASTWAWLAIVDAIAGQPFHTFATLGGIAAFTVVHLVLNLVLGVAVVYAVHGAAREPSVAMGLVFGSIMFEVAFAMVTVLLSNMVLGPLAWLEIFAGSMLGTAITLVVVARRHPLLAHLHRAETES
ncbi:MAG TPA: hypothetical protein VHQ45_18615 [Gemmatimonadaceae bacterium]|jgi:hypothetical protein|nr:hypothetical protein [Gemmatimonadaceae bacterium]